MAKLNRSNAKLFTQENNNIKLTMDLLKILFGISLMSSSLSPACPNILYHPNGRTPSFLEEMWLNSCCLQGSCNRQWFLHSGYKFVFPSTFTTVNQKIFWVINKRGHWFSTCIKFSENLTFFTHWYARVKHVSFSENFVHVLNEWSPKKISKIQFLLTVLGYVT